MKTWTELRNMYAALDGIESAKTLVNELYKFKTGLSYPLEEPESKKPEYLWLTSNGLEKQLEENTGEVLMFVPEKEENTYSVITYVIPV